MNGRRINRCFCSDAATSNCIRADAVKPIGCAVAMRGARLLSRRLRDSFAAKYSSAPAERGKENNHDVDGDRRRDAAACPAVLHHAGDRGQGERRARRDGRGRDRREAARAASPTSGSSSPTTTPSSSSTTRRPPFTVHVGGEATGEFAGRKFHWKVPSEIGFEIVRQLYRQNFDPAFTSPPPRSTMRSAFRSPISAIPIRCCRSTSTPTCRRSPPWSAASQFGQAVARTVTALGLKTVMLSSGGMSHFPGTDRYSNPELAWDNRCWRSCEAGNLKSLIGFDETELDDTGNIELRCWACAAGALGERKPDIVSMDPSWHHNYASLGLDRRSGRARARRALSLDQARAGRADLGAARARARCRASAPQYIADAAAYADRFRAAARSARGADQARPAGIVKMGAHPLVPFLAQMQIQRLRPRVADRRQGSECGALPPPSGEEGKQTRVPRHCRCYRVARREAGNQRSTCAVGLRRVRVTNSSISPRLWKCFRTTALAARASRLRSARNRARW